MTRKGQFLNLVFVFYRELHKLPVKELTDDKISSEMENLWQHLIGNHRRCDDNCKHKLFTIQTKTKPPRDHQLIRLENVNSVDKLMVRLNYVNIMFEMKIF